MRNSIVALHRVLDLQFPAKTIKPCLPETRHFDDVTFRVLALELECSFTKYASS